MPKFVILTHDHPTLHWDFMLETGETLRTWRLSAEPDSNETITAEPLPDHRREYLDYEGPVSKNRGEVKQWDQGDYETVEQRDDYIEVILTGNKLKGRAILKAKHSPLATHHSPLWHFTLV